MLTKRKKQVLEFIKKYISRNDYAPSFEEIKEYLKLSSVSTVHYHIMALQNMGYLQKESNQPRALNVFLEQKLIQIPILGTIAAGLPIEAVENKENIAIPQSKIKSSDNHYALRVRGESMENENIDNGDIVIVKNQASVENGQKAVVLINKNEATLKKVYKQGKQIRLESANPKFKPILVNSADINIQGIVVDIIKNQKLSRPSVLPKQEELSLKDVFCKNRNLPLNQIICGDAIENMKKIPNKAVDLVIADPPYNLSHGNKWAWNGEAGLPGFGGIWNKVTESWDNMTFKDYMNFTFSWLTEVKRILRQTGSIWVFGTYHNIGIINTVFQILGIEIINEIIWYKRNAFPNLSGRRFTASHETLLWGHAGDKSRKYYFNYMASKEFFDPCDNIKEKNKQMRTVWDIPNNKDREEIKHGKHPTQKPLRICKRMISLTSKENDIVLVPFAGAGSECIAAKELNRNYIGFELEKKYVDIANKRLINTQKILI